MSLSDVHLGTSFPPLLINQPQSEGEGMLDGSSDAPPQTHPATYDDRSTWSCKIVMEGSFAGHLKQMI